MRRGFTLIEAIFIGLVIIILASALFSEKKEKQTSNPTIKVQPKTKEELQQMHIDRLQNEVTALQTKLASTQAELSTCSTELSTCKTTPSSIYSGTGY